MYVDIIVWIWQKVNEAFPRNIYRLKVQIVTLKECEMVQGLLERH